MISLSLSVDDPTNSVSLVAQTDGATVSFLRRIGQDYEQVLATGVVVSGGVAVFIDTQPPQKTSLTYYAVDDTYERSVGAQCAVPSTYSLSRPVLNSDIHLGEMTFNTIDADGTVWTVTEIAGYWNLPDAQVPSVSRSSTDDGSYDDNGRYLARTMTLSGLFLPNSGSKLPAARDKLAQAFQAVRSTTQLTVDENPSKALTVRATGKSDITTLRQSGLSQFSIELTAADPAKYAVEFMTQPPPNEDQAFYVTPGVSAVGRTYPRTYAVDVAGTPGNQLDDVRQYGPIGAFNQCPIYNAGNYPTSPTIYLYGPATNPRLEIIETGEFMAFTIAINAGEYLEVDVKERSVLLNGTSSRRGTLTFDSTWIKLQPGVTTIKYTSQSSAASGAGASILAHSAWL